MAVDMACLDEKLNIIAVRQGLPSIGATLTNVHGIDWKVGRHMYACTYETLGRWREGRIISRDDIVVSYHLDAGMKAEREVIAKADGAVEYEIIDLTDRAAKFVTKKPRVIRLPNEGRGLFKDRMVPPDSYKQ